ncbi:hypothetical protein EVAR_15914_1 [Eumeta japonica]|uniref:Uncharacterized protein n=1 Tax=Eumeta variegata TaxID=151549 RepID=A0A4C1UL09_EUMVA|nr:hypothetical protein EVAR_15914_1 [Eumeta japonica]
MLSLSPTLALHLAHHSETLFKELRTYLTVEKKSHPNPASVLRTAIESEASSSVQVPSAHLYRGILKTYRHDNKHETLDSRPTLNGANQR